MLYGGEAVIHDRHPDRNRVWEVKTTNATRDSFYRAMLCIRGTLAMALCPSVRLSVCQSVRQKSKFY